MPYQLALSGIPNLVGDQYQIWLFELESRHAQRISDPTYNSDQPCWSPDGRRLAYVEQQAQDRSRIIVVDPMNVEQCAATSLFQGYLYGLRWHPTKPLIACTLTTYNPIQHTRFIYDLDTQHLEPLLNQDLQLDWLAPQWDSIMYTSQKADVMHISWCELPNLNVLHTWIDGTWEPIEWSPTGHQMAVYLFSQDEDQDEGSLGILDLQTSIIERYTTMAPDGSIAWSPDGTKIAFFRGDIGRYRLAVLDLQTKQTIDICPIHPNDLGELPPPQITWSADGRSIYTSSYIEIQCYILKIDSSAYTVEQLTPTNVTFQFLLTHVTANPVA